MFRLKNAADRKKDSFDTKIIRFTSTVMVILILSIALMYYVNWKTMYTEQLQRTNDSLTQQVAISYETMIKNITDSVDKIPLYDDDFIREIQNYRPDTEYKIQLFNKMSSIVLGNQYLFSTYLYFPARDAVFNSDSGTISALSDFTDNRVFQGRNINTVYWVDPRLVMTSSESNRLLMSVVLPVPISPLGASAELVVNIDAGRLYGDILRRISTENNINLYVYNKDKTILISNDQDLLFKKFSSAFLRHDVRNRQITSSYYSDALKWNFVLQTKITSSGPFSFALLEFILYLIFIFLLCLTAIVVLIKRFSKPMREILSDYKDNLWRDYLAGANTAGKNTLRRITAELPLMGAVFCVLTVQSTRAEDDRSEDRLMENVAVVSGCLKQKETAVGQGFTFKSHIAVMDQTHAAIILNFDHLPEQKHSDSLLADLTGEIMGLFGPDEKKHLYIGIGQPKESIELVPISYREACDALNYKIVSGTHVIAYPEVMERSAYYEYPYDIEKQIVNNLLTGDKEGACKYIDRFFDKLSDPELSLQDDEVERILYQLETYILREVGSLPIPVRVETDLSLTKLKDIESIKQRLVIFTERILEEIRQKNKTDFSLSKIFDHIEKRYLDDDFNLNIAADELSLNRNYLAKVVREHAGATFNDHINHKRMETAKKMIVTENLTIDEIAHRVGYNYTHYFIKVFKSFEGITPGQYRERLAKNR